MKFKSSTLTQVSGSIGGLTFAHNQAGMYIRGRGLPANPATPAQETIRNAMSAAQTAWKNLSSAVRSGWAAYALNTPITNPLGDPAKLSGLAMYLRQYVLRAQTGQTQITTNPTSNGLSNLSALTVSQHLTQDAVDIVFNNTNAWATTTGGFLAVYQSAPKGPTNNFFKGPYKFLGVLPGNTATPPTSPFFATSLYPLESGQRYFFRAIAVDATGRLSAPVTFQFDVA